MIYNINILICDIKAIINEIKSKGITVVSTSLKESKSLKNMPKMDKYAIVFGNEGNGVSREVKELCDCNFYIPMSNDVESLNVGVACSIILYELER